jgi:hypothetical protein
MAEQPLCRNEERITLPPAVLQVLPSRICRHLRGSEHGFGSSGRDGESKSNASRAARADVDSARFGALMRYSDIRTTMNIYGDVVTDEMSEAHSKPIYWGKVR